MNNHAIEMLKRRFDNTCKVFDNIEEGGYVNLDISMPYRKVLRMDIAQYLMYLAASDFCLTSEEVDFINRIVSIDYDLDQMIDYINRYDLNSSNYRNIVPLSLIIAAEEEEYGISGVGNPHPIALYSLYEDIGRAIIGIDGRDTYLTEKNYKLYLNELRFYLKDRGYYISLY